MRFKVAPPPRPLDVLDTARSAVPLVPDDEADCCHAIRRAIDCDDRETAREYLTFLQALGLVAESDRGYHRTREAMDRDALAAAFRERVFLAEELIQAVAGGPHSAGTVFESVRNAVPRWERERSPDWEDRWRQRVDHLLAWAVLFGFLTVDDGGFAPSQ